MEALEEREPNEAFAVSDGEGAYAVYFTDGGAVRLRVPEGAYTVRWIEANRGEWQESLSATAGAEGLRVAAPGSAHWIALVERK